jgi:hypothetical protein
MKNKIALLLTMTLCLTSCKFGNPARWVNGLLPGSITEEDNGESEVSESLKLAQEANESVQLAVNDESAPEEFKKEAAEISHDLESIIAEATDKKSANRQIKDIVTRAKDVAERANTLKKSLEQSRAESEKKSLLAKVQEVSESALNSAQETIRMAKTVSNEDIFNESLKMLNVAYEIHYGVSTLNFKSEPSEIKTWIEYSSKVIQNCAELQEKIKVLEETPEVESLVRQAILESQKAASVTLSAVYVFDEEGLDSSDLRSLSEKAQIIYEAALVTEEGDDKRAQEIIDKSNEIIRIVKKYFDKNDLDYSLVDQDPVAQAKEKSVQIVEQARKYYSVLEVMIADGKIETVVADEITSLYKDIESIYERIHEGEEMARRVEMEKRPKMVEEKATAVEEAPNEEPQPVLAAPIAKERKRIIRPEDDSSEFIIEGAKKMSVQFEEFKKLCDKAGVIVAES